ncbi:hypothetical protein SAMN05216556_1473, partial [Aequorivita viscosa]|uniref:hypothetical protein n=1 Tax=Aequorivita viscosa TaxID=797419 RepID=UPI00089D3EA5
MKSIYLFLALTVPILSFGQSTPCSIDNSGNNFENAEFGLDIKYIANDFDVVEGTVLEIEKVKPTIVNNIGTADIFIYEDNNGKPGTLITSFQSVAPTSQTLVNNKFGLPWYEVELTLPSTVSLIGYTGGSKYWLGLIVTMGSDAGSANFWEVKTNGSTVFTHSSVDQGTSWTPSPSGFDGVFEISGECSIHVPVPIGFCEIIEEGNNFENAEIGLNSKYIANDFDIEEGTIMELNKIIPTIVNNIGVADIFIYEDNNGQPGTLITSFQDVVPTSQTQVSSNFSLPWYEVELELPTAVTLEGLPGGSKYWIGLFVTAGSDGASNNFWEIKSNGTTAYIHTSVDQGATWIASTSNYDGVFQVSGICSNVETEPTEPCEIIELGNNFENAEFGLNLKYIANDIDIAEGITMEINKILPTLINNIETANIFIYEDNNGQPGTLITSFQNVTPTSQTQVSNNFNLPWYEVALDLPNSVLLEGLAGGSKYWIGLKTTLGSGGGSANFWEVKSNGDTAFTHTSLDQGATWTPSTSGFDGVFQVFGVCSEEEPEPIGACEIIEAGNNFENAEVGLNTKYIANDFDIEEGVTMEINKITPTIINNIEVADIFIYEDNDGQPGNLITSFQDVVPTSQTQVSSNFSLPWYEVELELPSSVSLAGLSGGSKYWIGL